MRSYEIDSANVETGQRKTLTIVLTSEDVAATRAYGHAYPDIVLKAKALQKAYREASSFRHTGPEGIRETILN